MNQYIDLLSLETLSDILRVKFCVSIFSILYKSVIFNQTINV